MTTLTASIVIIATLTALFIALGLAQTVLDCWNAQAPATLSPEALETLQAIQEASDAYLYAGEPCEYGVEAIEDTEETEDFWMAPSNPLETAIATIKANSQKPEIKLLAAPQPLTVAQINRMKKAELEIECQKWNVEKGIVKVMKDRLKEVAVF